MNTQIMYVDLSSGGSLRSARLIREQKNYVEITEMAMLGRGGRGEAAAAEYVRIRRRHRRTYTHTDASMHMHIQQATLTHLSYTGWHGGVRPRSGSGASGRGELARGHHELALTR